MQTLAIQATQNQTFTTTLDSNLYNFSIYLAGGGMCVDIACNNVQLVSGERILGGEFMIPFAYQGPNGNFIMLTTNYDLVDFNEFGTTQTLVYLTAAEMATAVGGTTP
jgi:hypothetical protein